MSLLELFPRCPVALQTADRPWHSTRCAGALKLPESQATNTAGAHSSHRSFDETGTFHFEKGSKQHEGDAWLEGAAIYRPSVGQAMRSGRRRGAGEEGSMFCCIARPTAHLSFAPRYLGKRQIVSFGDGGSRGDGRRPT